MILSSHGNLSTPYVCTNRAACCQKMSEVHLCHLVLLLLVPAWQLFLSTTPASRQACATVCDRTFQTFSFACVCWNKSQVEGLDNLRTNNVLTSSSNFNETRTRPATAWCIFVGLWLASAPANIARHMRGGLYLQYSCAKHPRHGS